MSTTYAYSPQFLDLTGTPLPNVVVTIYAHGAAQTPANVVATGTTNSSGNLIPAATLNVGATYDFTTSSGLMPYGEFTTSAPRQIVLVPGPQGVAGQTGGVGPAGPVGPIGPTGLSSGPAGSTSAECLALALCTADFTPQLGLDLGGIAIVPFDPATGNPIAWTITGLVFRMETPGSSISSVKIQRSTGVGAFTNVGYLNTTSLDIAPGSYQNLAPVFAISSVNSGDKLAPEYTAIGTGAANFTLYAILTAI